MISRKTAAFVSTVAVGSMIFVAWSEVQHGTPAGEVHVFASAPVTVSSTSIGGTGFGFHFNAVTEAEYRAVADSTPLHNDGVTYPSST